MNNGFNKEFFIRENGLNTYTKLLDFLECEVTRNTCLLYTSIYDAAGRVVATIDPNGNRLDFGYDANDNMTSITDAEGSAWAYTFDALGNKLSETDPLGNTLTFTYDAMSRMLTSTDADGYTTTSVSYTHLRASCDL